MITFNTSRFTFAARAVVLSMGVATAMIACTSTPEKVGNAAHGEVKPTTVASIEAKQVAAEQQAAYVVEIDFAGKKSELSAEAKRKIAAFYANIAEPSKLKEGKIIAWADQEYPAREKRKLTEAEVALAKQRGDVIEAFLKSKNGSLTFEKFNMTERPGKLNEYVGGADARIKDSLERAGISTTEDRATPKARRAIVMLILNEQKPEKKN